MAKKSTGMIVGLVIGGVVLCCGLPLVGMFGMGLWAVNKFGGLATCAVGITQTRDATLAYAAANNGKLPSAKTWMDDIRPFLKQEVGKEKDNPFKFDTSGVYQCKDDKGVTGLAFNSALSGKKLSTIKDQVSAIVIFEIEKPELNAARPYKPLPESTSPEIMNGERRGWFKIPLSGDAILNEKKFGNRRGTKFSIEN